MTKYLPILRSRAAELRGLKELTDQAREKLFPVIELTRSRRSRTNPGGDLSKSVEAVADILGSRPYVVDLTSLASLQNSEFEQLFDEDDGFRAWTDFVSNNLGSNCVPVVHLLEPFERDSFQTQTERLRLKFSQVALRIPTSYRDFDVLMEACDDIFGSLQDVVLILDVGYVTQSVVAAAQARIAEMLSALADKEFSSVSVASSSFPNSVVSAGGDDDKGSFPLHEVVLWNNLRAQFPDLDYGDYAAIHPVDFQGTVTNWVPRVDVMLDESFYYHRYRRSEGGYIKAAQMAYRDKLYVPLDCWAQGNIQAAADGNPPGRSPSFWIANRVNFHLTRQVRRVVR